MTENEKNFLENLNKGRDLDFIANNGYMYSKDELIKMVKELFYTSYQFLDKEYKYKDFIKQFIENMKEYEDYFTE